MNYTKEYFMNELIKRFPNNNVEILEFSGASKPIRYKCLDCGRLYFKTRANHIYENKTLCQKCYTAKESKIRDWILNFFKKTERFILINKNWKSTSENLQMRCLDCGRDFIKEPANLYLKNEKTICPYCGENGSPILLEEFIRRLPDKDKNEYTILKYKNYNSSATFKHKCGYVFTRTPNNFLKSKGCPKCFGKMSAGELAIQRFLLTNNIKYIYEKRFPEWNIGYRSYDFYLPELNYLIEYQGAQHYVPADHFGGKEHFLIQQESDRIKKEAANKNNVPLIIIPYTDLQKIDSYLLPLLEVQRLSRKGVGPSGSKEKAV